MKKYLFLYACTSYYFLKNPYHKKKPRIIPKTNKKVIYAHRGGSLEAAENSLEAFSRLPKNIVLETDTHMTKDKVVVLAHDPNTLRLTGVNKEIRDTFYGDLPPYVNGEIQVEFAQANKKVNGERYCSLDELFRHIPRSQVVQIEVKDAFDQASCEEVYKVIKNHDRLQTTVVGCKLASHLQNIKAAGIPLTICPWEHGLLYFCAYVTGLLPFIEIPHTVFNVPYFSRMLMQARLNELSQTTALKDKIRLLLYCTIFPIVNRMSEPLIEHLNKRGIHTCYWVVNSDMDLQYLAKTSKVEGLMTDRPLEAGALFKN